MANWHEEATWECPVCGYVLIGEQPNNPVMVVCDKCKKKPEPDKWGSEFTDNDGNPITEEEQERANHEQDKINKGEI